MIPLLALLACPSGPGTAERYAAAAALAETDPAAAGEACQALPSPLSDECLSFAARAAAPTDPELAAELCGRCGPTVWADECHFLLAEALVPTRGGAVAATACAQAGRFQGNCLDHVWRAHAASLLAERSPAEAAAAYAPARAWAAGVVPEGGELTGRFWQKFYDAPLHDDALPPLDAAWCAAMAPEQAATCSRLLPEALRRTLVRLERERSTQGQPIDRRVLCGPGEAPGRVQAAFGLTWVAGPELDGVAQRFVAQRCGSIPG